MDLYDKIFNFEVNTKTYGNLFFKSYPEDEKRKAISEIINNNSDESDLFRELFKSVYSRAKGNKLTFNDIDLALITEEEKKDFLSQFFIRHFYEYEYDNTKTIKENFNLANELEQEQLLEYSRKQSLADKVFNDIVQREKSIGQILNGSSIHNLNNYILNMKNILPAINYITPASNFAFEASKYERCFKLISENYDLYNSAFNNNYYSSLESAINKFNIATSSWFGRIESLPSSMTFSKQLDILSGSKAFNVLDDTLKLARTYIPENYGISGLYKDCFSNISIYIKNKEDEDEPDYCLNDIEYDKGFIEFLHDIPEKDVLKFLTHLQDYPYLALLDDVGKSVFDAVQSKITDCTKTISGQIFYRARAKKQQDGNYTTNQIGSPQYGVPGMGRYNFLGKPYFYVASDAETARKEVECKEYPLSTVMKLNQEKQMNVFDISSEDCPLVTYCNIDKGDGNDYTPYLVPSFISVCCAYLNKKKRHSVDAIKYKSVKNPGGFCYVILDKSYNDFFDDGEIVL